LNSEDQRFWDGFLKGVMASEFEIWGVEVENEAEWKIKERIQKKVQVLERRVKLLHTEDLLVFLHGYWIDEDNPLSWTSNGDHKKKIVMKSIISEEKEL
jgi:hypothetical protein